MSTPPDDVAAPSTNTPGTPGEQDTAGVADPMAALRALLVDYDTAEVALRAEHHRADTSADPTDVAAPSFYQARDDAAVALVQAARPLLGLLTAAPVCTAQGQPCAYIHTEECNARRGLWGLALTYPGQLLDPWAPWADLGEDVAPEMIQDGVVDLLCAARLCGVDPDRLAYDAIKILDDEARERRTDDEARERRTSVPLDEGTSW